MVDTSNKLDKITDMIDEGLYFTINRARQFGKTTTFGLLRRRLGDRYLVVKTSFEGFSDNEFQTIKNFCGIFANIFADGLRIAKTDTALLSLWKNRKPENIYELGNLITDFCEKSEKPVILLIDEVDKTSHNQNFLDFLGLLRNKYLLRNKGADYTFQSVILAGVYDVKNLKLKIMGEKALALSNERTHNSPWNIAADFKVDMSFNPAEIATMLADYENDFRTGMDISEISDEIYRYTNGYPFLVSKICKIIDEDLEKDWTVGGVAGAVKILLKDRNTLFDDLFKNLENNKKLYDLIFDIMISGSNRTFSIGHPEIELAAMFGILIDKDGKAAVSNEIFEILISDYFAAKLQDITPVTGSVLKEDVVENGKFDMALCLEKFGRHFYEMYSENDEKFLEKYCRMLFITYLKPLINGQGFYHIEAQTRNVRRMDLIVDYGNEQFVVELKLWCGDRRHEDAYAQLCGYLDGKGLDTGYLLTFDFRKVGKETKAEWVEFGGKRIFDVVI
jgi:hypothetical protein